MIEIYADGACQGNPGPGGWGALLIHADRDARREIFGGERNTTNNRMELTAAIEALKCLKYKCVVTIYTDSQYVVKGITEWMPNWIANGWVSSSRKPVKNADLWIALNHLAAEHTISWVWVKGHAGNPGNECADALANKGIKSLEW